MINWLIIIFTDWLMVIYHFHFQRLNKSKNTYNFFHNHIMLVRHSKFHVEIFVQFTLILQLIKEMEGRAPDLLDAMATVTVPVANEDEVKCLQCVIYG